MTQAIAQTGTFRGPIVSFGLNKAESGAVGVAITAMADECFGDGEWHDWRGHEIEASGTIWIVKKDGKLNERQVQDLISCAGWDGDLRSIANGTWEPTSIQYQVQEDEYRGEVQYRIAWLRAYDSTPGGGNVDSSEAASLQQQFGSKLRALAGNSKRNAQPPSGRPAKPAAPPAEPKQPVAASSGPDSGDVGGDDIPF